MKRLLLYCCLIGSFCSSCKKREDTPSLKQPVYTYYAGLSHFASVTTSDQNIAVLAGDNGYVSLLKISQTGTEIWKKKVISTFDFNMHGLVQTTDGGFLIAGTTPGFDSVLLIKVNNAGDRIWSRTYFSKGIYDPAGILNSNDGNYFVYGTAYPANSTRNNNIYVTKYNNDGDVLWQKDYDPSGNNTALQAILTSDGGICITGMNSPTSRIYNAYLLKISAKGDKQWDKYILPSGATTEISAYSTTECPDKGFIVCGSERGQLFALKTGSTGHEVWRQLYSADSISYARGASIVANIDRTCSITGSAAIRDSIGCMIANIDQSGKLEFCKVLPGSRVYNGVNILKAVNGDNLILGDRAGIYPDYVPQSIFFTRVDINGGYR